MNEVGAENLQAFLQFFDVMLNIFFAGGSFMKAVTDVDVHEHLELANEERKPVLSELIVHLHEKWKTGNCKGKVVEANFFGNPRGTRMLGEAHLRQSAATDMIREL